MLCGRMNKVQYKKKKNKEHICNKKMIKSILWIPFGYKSIKTDACTIFIYKVVTIYS